MPVLLAEMTYTFESFVVSAASQEAWSAALAAAQRRDRRALVLIGPCGAGKSHLLHAIEHAMRGDVLRVSAVALSDWLVDAIRRDAFDDFGTRLAAFDALLVDDIGLLADKPRIEQEIVSQLDKVASRGTCVVVASDRPLRRPLANARVATLGYPDAAARVELARRAAAEGGVPLPDNVLRLVAKRRSVPEMRGRILRLGAEARRGR